MFRKQPKIEIKPNATDRKIMSVGWILVALNFIVILFFYIDLPETIPTHFSLKGEPDGYGSKSTLWVLPVINLALYYGLSLIITKMKPWNYNYPTKVTEKNAPDLYGMSIRMMVWLNFGIVLLFLVISLHTILLIKSVQGIDLGWLIFALMIIVTLAPFYFIIKMFKVQKA